MHLMTAFQRRRITNLGLDRNQTRLAFGRFRLLNLGQNLCQIGVAIRDKVHAPIVGFKSLADRLGKRQIGAAIDLNIVIVVQQHQIVQLEMSCQRARFRGHTLLQTTVATKHVHFAVEQLLAKQALRIFTRNGQTDCLRQTLTQRTRRQLDAVCHIILRMARRNTVELTERFQVLHTHLIATQMQHGVLQSTCMSIGQHKTIAIGEQRIRAARIQDFTP
mmetsp:Transcript_16441/g.25358  ORF Transcript_16441/g.25358 Transcript_16441/m.25358 type:complete len:219 (+) Transcript_16441:1119-1775(+)